MNTKTLYAIMLHSNNNLEIFDFNVIEKKASYEIFDANFNHKKRILKTDMNKIERIGYSVRIYIEEKDLTDENIFINKLIENQMKFLSEEISFKLDEISKMNSMINELKEKIK